MKAIALIFVGMLLAGGGVAAYMKFNGTLSSKPPAVEVRVEKIVEGNLTEVISAPGEIQPRVKISISAKVAAPILELPFKEGMRVQKDAVLVRLDAKELEAALNSAKARQDAAAAQVDVSKRRIEANAATIESLTANLDDAREDFKRQTKLRTTDDVSEAAVETSKAKYLALEAQYRSSKASLEADKANQKVEEAQLKAAEADTGRATDDLSYTVIKSPIDGVVTRRKSEVGEMVVPGIQGSPGTTIMEVSDLSQMLMVARIDESGVAQVEKGQDATIRMEAFPDKVFKGRVEWIATARADTSSAGGNGGGAISDSGVSGRYFECKLQLDSTDARIKPGLSADADISVHHHHGLRVASQAVVGRPTDGLPSDVRSKMDEAEQAKSISTVVFRIVKGKAVVTPVKVGASDETHTMILRGLSPGDQVIVGPFKALELMNDGQEVKEMSAVKTTGPS